MLALKGNQSGLADDMQQLFEQGMETDFAGQQHAVHETTETGHGRTDERTCHVIAIPEDHPQRARWQDLNTLVVTVSHRVTADKDTWESRLYVSSHRPHATLLADAARRHWSIENSQHWVLDVVFGEDHRRQQDRNGAANFAAVRRLAVSLLRREKTNKRGAKNKRLHCALDPNYLLTVLHTADFDAPALLPLLSSTLADAFPTAFTLTIQTNGRIKPTRPAARCLSRASRWLRHCRKCIVCTSCPERKALPNHLLRLLLSHPFATVVANFPQSADCTNTCSLSLDYRFLRDGLHGPSSPSRIPLALHCIGSNHSLRRSKSGSLYAQSHQAQLPIFPNCADVVLLLLCAYGFFFGSNRKYFLPLKRYALLW